MLLYISAAAADLIELFNALPTRARCCPATEINALGNSTGSLSDRRRRMDPTTPHRFDVTGRTDRLVTQVYFPGEPLNEIDQLLTRIRRKDAVIVKILPPTADLEPSSVIAAWDAILSRRCSSLRINESPGLDEPLGCVRGTAAVRSCRWSRRRGRGP